MEYTVVKAENFDDLIRNVAEWMDSGWKPQGGVAVSPDGSFYQAMIRDLATQI